MLNIGIDVHKKRCVVAIKGKPSELLEQTDFENTAKGISGFIRHVKDKYGGPMRAACESTGNYWIRTHDMLEDAGIKTSLLHPAKTKVIAYARLKDDKVDSEVISDLLRSDMIYESFVPDSYYRDLRNLTRVRVKFTRKSTEMKNMAYAILAKYDHTRPDCGLFTKKGRKWLQVIKMSELDRMVMDAHLDVMDTADCKAAELGSKIAKIGISDERVRLIMTMPGIGYFIALSVIAEIVDVKRFATAEKLVSYAGISPSHRNSGETRTGGAITKQGSTWLRKAMMDAATVAIRFDPRMKSIHGRIAKRRGKQKAKVAVARHMLEIVWHMLSTMEEYRTKNDEMVRRKFKLMKRVSRAT